VPAACWASVSWQPGGQCAAGGGWLRPGTAWRHAETAVQVGIAPCTAVSMSGRLAEGWSRSPWVAVGGGRWDRARLVAIRARYTTWIGCKPAKGPCRVPTATVPGEKTTGSDHCATKGGEPAWRKPIGRQRARGGLSTTFRPEPGTAGTRPGRVRRCAHTGRSSRHRRPAGRPELPQGRCRHFIHGQRRPGWASGKARWTPTPQLNFSRRAAGPSPSRRW